MNRLFLLLSAHLQKWGVAVCIFGNPAASLFYYCPSFWGCQSCRSYNKLMLHFLKQLGWIFNLPLLKYSTSPLSFPWSKNFQFTCTVFLKIGNRSAIQNCKVSLMQCQAWDASPGRTLQEKHKPKAGTLWRGMTKFQYTQVWNMSQL